MLTQGFLQAKGVEATVFPPHLLFPWLNRTTTNISRPEETVVYLNVFIIAPTLFSEGGFCCQITILRAFFSFALKKYSFPLGLWEERSLTHVFLLHSCSLFLSLISAAHFTSPDKCWHFHKQPVT